MQEKQYTKHRSMYLSFSRVMFSNFSTPIVLLETIDFIVCIVCIHFPMLSHLQHRKLSCFFLYHNINTNIVNLNFVPGICNVCLKSSQKASARAKTSILINLEITASYYQNTENVYVPELETAWVDCLPSYSALHGHLQYPVEEPHTQHGNFMDRNMGMKEGKSCVSS